MSFGETRQRLQSGAERVLRAAQQHRAVGCQGRSVDGRHEDVARRHRRVGSNRQRPLGDGGQQAAAPQRVEHLAAVGRCQRRRIERQRVLAAVR